MNHKLIVVSQLKKEADSLRTQLAGVEAAIVALGGTITGDTGKATGKRKAGGWPKGKARGPKAGKSAVNGEVKTSAPASTDLIPADLQATIDAIKANPKLKGIQKAQAVRKAKLEYFKGQSTATAPGAALGEAAAS